VWGQVTATGLARAYGWAGRLGSSGFLRRHRWPAFGGHRAGRGRGLGWGWRARRWGVRGVVIAGVSPHAPPELEGIAGRLTVMIGPEQWRGDSGQPVLGGEQGREDRLGGLAPEGGPGHTGECRSRMAAGCK